jgi:hypothetical protein
MTATQVARFDAADGGGRPADRESLRELALRKPQGPVGLPTDLAVRGEVSLGTGSVPPRTRVVAKVRRRL